MPITAQDIQNLLDDTEELTDDEILQNISYNAILSVFFSKQLTKDLIGIYRLIYANETATTLKDLLNTVLIQDLRYMQGQPTIDILYSRFLKHNETSALPKVCNIDKKLIYIAVKSTGFDYEEKEDNTIDDEATDSQVNELVFIDRTSMRQRILKNYVNGITDILLQSGEEFQKQDNYWSVFIPTSSSNMLTDLFGGGSTLAIYIDEDFNLYTEIDDYDYSCYVLGDWFKQYADNIKRAQKIYGFLQQIPREELVGNIDYNKSVEKLKEYCDLTDEELGLTEDEEPAEITNICLLLPVHMGKPYNKPLGILYGNNSALKQYQEGIQTQSPVFVFVPTAFIGSKEEIEQELNVTFNIPEDAIRLTGTNNISMIQKQQLTSCSTKPKVLVNVQATNPSTQEILSELERDGVTVFTTNNIQTANQTIITRKILGV